MFSEKLEAKKYMAELGDLLTRLQQVLAAERQAILERDAHELTRQGEHKAELCEQLADRGRDYPSLADLLTAIPAEWRNQFDADHKTLLELAQSTRDYNLVNGKILHRSQQFAREMLNIMSGKTNSGAGGLYGQSGQQAEFDTQSTAVVKA